MILRLPYRASVSLLLFQGNADPWQRLERKWPAMVFAFSLIVDGHTRIGGRLEERK